jgi:hypothetical protein
MSQTAEQRRHFRGLVAALMLISGCGLTVTNEPPPFEELDQPEQSAVEIIYGELKALDTVVRQRSKALFGREVDLSPLVDRNKINVSFEGMLFNFNFGNGVLHVAAWENLSEQQRSIAGTWFGTTAPDTEASYKKFCYRFMALAHGMKQFMYNLTSVDNVYQHKYLFSMEFDSTRAAHAYLAETGRKAEMWPFVAQACAAVIQDPRHKSAYGAFFTPAESGATPMRFPQAKVYMQDHWRELANPVDPSGYMYFLCQAITVGQAEARSLNAELLEIDEDLDF